MIRHGRESRKSVLVNINPKWIDAIDKDIDSEIILEAVYEMRLHHVPLHNHGVGGLDSFPISRYVYPFSLA